MPQLSSCIGTGVSKDVRAHRTNLFLLACASTLLASIAFAAGDQERPRPNHDVPSAEQRDRPSLRLQNSEVRKESSPPTYDSVYESEEDCE